MADGDPHHATGRQHKKKNPVEWHGHRIVTENDLDTVFADTGDVERPHIYLRRLRHGIVLILLVSLLAAAVYVAIGINRGDIRIAALEPDPAPTALGCPVGPFTYIDPATVTVNVFNSTNVTGLAGTASTLLAERQFTLGEVGNRRVNRTGMTAIVVSGPAGHAQAFTVQRHIPGTDFLQDERTDTSVDVVVGSGFETLNPADTVDTAPGPLSCPRLSPSADPSASGAQASSATP